MSTALREYKEVLYLEYDSVENSFYDDGGFHIDNILDFLKPSDLFLFRNDYDYNVFTHRSNKDIVCVIWIRYEDHNLTWLYGNS